jgi:hypothetical protein
LWLEVSEAVRRAGVGGDLVGGGIGDFGAVLALRPIAEPVHQVGQGVQVEGSKAVRGAGDDLVGVKLTALVFAKIASLNR